MLLPARWLTAIASSPRRQDAPRIKARSIRKGMGAIPAPAPPVGFGPRWWVPGYPDALMFGAILPARRRGR
jgi:hypothetical protein